MWFARLLRTLTDADLALWHAACGPGGTFYPYLVAELARRQKGQ